MVERKTTSVPCIQSIAIKTSITQQRCLCPTQQDAGEFHTAVPLKAGGWDHTEVELREQRQCLYSQPSDHCNGAQSTENPGQQARWHPQLHPVNHRCVHGHRRWGSSGTGAWDPIPPATDVLMTLVPALPHLQRQSLWMLQKQGMVEVSAQSWLFPLCLLPSLVRPVSQGVPDARKELCISGQ